MKRGNNLGVESGEGESGEWIDGLVRVPGLENVSRLEGPRIWSTFPLSWVSSGRNPSKTG